MRAPFAILGSQPHYAPDLPFRPQHVLLNLTVEPKLKTFEGTVTHRVQTIAPNQAWVVLDQIGLEVEGARVGNQAAKFELEGSRLRVAVGKPEPGTVLEVEIRFRGQDPRRGLYFTGPDEHYPAKPWQVWSQGQDEDSRYWFPSFDYPNQKATSEMIARVPKGFTAVSNGALLSRKVEGAYETFHYKLGTPHVTYLITLAVAEFEAWEDAGPGGVPVQYFVAPGRKADGVRAFSHTPRMIEVYARRTGQPYPYEKYSQVAVQDFIFGGMENTSATTQTDLTLHDERAHLDSSSDPLVSHELAHQWFGDLLTCRDWSHGWLNEGFATFMERVWIEDYDGNDTGLGGGPDEAKYYGYADLKEYLDEDTGKYRRPIVCNTYAEPIDLFDAHLYQKGGLVLNLLRATLGEEAFWSAIRLYVQRHKGGSVETLDLIRAIEDATGRNMRRFFDEWVFGAGHPEFELSYVWHDVQKLAEVVIEQKQTLGLPFVDKDGARTHLFHVPAKLELTFEGGKKVTRSFMLGEPRERVFLACESKPLMVRFDPNCAIPKTLKFPRPKELLLYQLAQDEDCMGRIEAARELIGLADPAVVEALGTALREDKFWGVRAEIAAVLAEIKTPAARDALLSAKEKHPRARRAWVAALGAFRDAAVAQALRPLAEKDPSYFVEAEAGHAWALTRSAPVPAPSEKDLAETETLLLGQLKKPSYRETIRAQSLQALAGLAGVERGERPKVLDALLEWSRRGHEQDARSAAVLGLGKVAEKAIPSLRARILEALGHLADEPNFRLRMALVAALRRAGGPDASLVLWKIQGHEVDGRVKRSAKTAQDAIFAAGATPEAVGSLKSQLDKLEEEYRKLRGQVEETRAGLKG